MHIKPSYLLSLYEAMNARKELTVDESQKLTQLRKGFEGEKKLATLIVKKIQTDVRMINGLILTVNDQTIEMDILLIRPDALYLYEVKNYKGSYINGKDTITNLFGSEYVNPLNQLSRTTILLRKWLKKERIAIPIKEFVVYINPEFTLFGASESESILLPSQINSHFEQMNTNSNSFLKKHDYLLNRLKSNHQIEAAFQRKLPTYSFEELKKGVTCFDCYSLNVQLTQRTYYCQACDSVGHMSELIIKQIEDFRLLFPGSRMTTSTIYDWCNGCISKKRIWAILKNNFIQIGSGKGAYYV